MKDIYKIIEDNLKDTDSYKSQVLFIGNKIGDDFNFFKNNKPLSKIEFLTILKNKNKQELSKKDLFNFFDEIFSKIDFKKDK